MVNAFWGKKSTAMKKHFKFLIFFFLISIFCKAAPVDVKKAEKVAYNFIFERADMSIRKNLSLSLTEIKYDESQKNILCYIFDITPEGFIIVSADDNLVPVIAYAFEGKYVKGYNKTQEYWLSEQLALGYQNMIEDAANKQRWQLLQHVSAPKSIKGVSPLCTTRWDQGQYYNYMCPVDSNGPGYHAYAGCVATAMGQVMKRWNHPINGNSGYAYQHIWPMYFYNYGVVQANFAATTYQWSNMPNQIGNSNKEAVATLLFHCGVSVKMSYGPDGSGAHTESVPFALNHYFKYHPSIEFIERAFMSSSKWDSIVMSQLDNGFPMVYSGSDVSAGHAWVVDGYQDSCYFHINWGWSGFNNGYYYFSNLNSGNGDFTNYQGAVINIFPEDFVAVNSPENISFNIYPNPALDYFKIDIADNEFYVEVIDLKGVTVKSFKNQKIGDTAGMENGLYFIRVTTKNNISKISKLLIIK